MATQGYLSVTYALEVGRPSAPCTEPPSVVESEIPQHQLVTLPSNTSLASPSEQVAALVTLVPFITLGQPNKDGICSVPAGNNQPSFVVRRSLARTLDHLSSVAALLLDPQARYKASPTASNSSAQLITEVTAKPLPAACASRSPWPLSIQSGLRWSSLTSNTCIDQQLLTLNYSNYRYTMDTKQSTSAGTYLNQNDARQLKMSFKTPDLEN